MEPKPLLPPRPWWPERFNLWGRHRALIEHERALARWLHRATLTPWALLALTAASRLGDGPLWFAVVLLLPWLDTARGGVHSLHIVAVSAINLAIYGAVKHSTARPRPFRGCPGIRECARSLDEHSFPSGHAMHAVAFAVMLGAFYPAAAMAVWTFAAFTAVSRVMLGLHYPSDVAAGSVIGGAVAGISLQFL